MRMVLPRDTRAAASRSTRPRSRKARELAANPPAALLFYWHRSAARCGSRAGRAGAGRGVGATTSGLGRAAADRRLGSSQSEVIGSRDALEARFSELEEFQGEDVPLPPHWGGYRLVPETGSSGSTATAASTIASATPARWWGLDDRAPRPVEPRSSRTSTSTPSSRPWRSSRILSSAQAARRRRRPPAAAASWRPRTTSPASSASTRR